MSAFAGALLYWAAVIALMLEVRRELFVDERREAPLAAGRRPRGRWARVLETAQVLAVLAGVALTVLRLRAGA